MDHSYLDRSLECDIETMVWSDHSPVFLTFSVPSAPLKEWTWKLNDALLQSPECVARISETISNFLSDHDTDSTSLPIQWEALQAIL